MPLPVRCAANGSLESVNSFVVLMTAVPLLIALIVLAAVVSSIKRVPHGQAAVVERLGRFHRVVDRPGTVLLLPLFDRVAHWVDLTEQQIEYPPEPVPTKDKHEAVVSGTVRLQVVEPRAAVYEILDYQTAVQQVTLTTTHNLISGMTRQDSFSARGSLSRAVDTELNKYATTWGLRILEVRIEDISPTV